MQSKASEKEYLIALLELVVPRPLPRHPAPLLVLLLSLDVGIEVKGLELRVEGWRFREQG